MKEEDNKLISKKQKRRLKKRRRKRIIIAVIIAAVAVGSGIGIYYAVTSHKNAADSEVAVEAEDSGTNVTYTNKADEKEAEEAFNNTPSNSNEESLDAAVPTEENLNVDSIKGYTNEEGNGVESSLTLPYSVPDTPFTIESIGSYSGAFVEDGSNNPVENILAIVVKNNSDTMAQYGEIKLLVNDSEEVLFKVTNLPAKTSALLMDTAGQKQFASEDTYKYENSMYAELNGEASLMEDKLKIGTKDNKIIIKNISDEDLGTVYVYYKYVQEGGAYLGGITFRTKFEKVTPGAELEAVAGHFLKNGSSIMMVDSIKSEN